MNDFLEHDAEKQQTYSGNDELQQTDNFPEHDEQSQHTYSDQDGQQYVVRGWSR